MTQEQFDFLCEKLGDPELPSDEKWKSIQYIHVHGSYEPMGSFQEMLARDQIYYYKNDTLGGGFIYLSTPDASYDPLRTGYTISWIGLDVISEITFKGFQDYESLADKIYGVSDVMQILGVNAPLITSIYVDPVRIPKKDAETYEVRVSSTRPITRDDFDVMYYDNLGNQLNEKPTKVGNYTVKVKCKGKYIGENHARYEIYNDWTEKPKKENKKDYPGYDSYINQ